jgi:CheY-like chemotaxis protein
VIKVNSKVGKGTTFYVYLPALEGGKETSQVPASFTVGHKGKILLMDDEELIRNIAGELLKTLEHEVEFADRGEEAIGKYQSAREADKPFDIVILDLTIRGGMGGKETIKRLLAIDPGIKAIVSSGYSDDAVVAAYEKYGFKARLTKPYKLENLRDTLNALLSI